MIQPGKRPFYVIMRASTYDGLECNVAFITHDKTAAIKRFRFLYDIIYDDYLNEDGDFWADRTDCGVSVDKEKASGSFAYWEDNGELDYTLQTIYSNQLTNMFGSTGLEDRFKSVANRY